MPFCPNCRAKINTSDKFCGKCGKDLKEQNSTVVAPINNSAQKQVKYEGTVHKCPFCGETVESLKANCPSCGKEFRDSPSALTVKEFSERLIEISKNPPKNRKVTSSDPILPVDRMKIELIQGFPIPSTKEDIIEFLVLANSNIISDSYFHGTYSQREQAMQKARIVLGDCAELKIIEESYNNKKNKIKNSKTKNVLVWVAFALVVGLMYVFMGVETNNSQKERNQRFENENYRLELILDDINEAIDDKDYDKAKLLTARLVFNTSDYNKSAEEKWDGIREDMYQRISELESKSKKKK